jgi:hypothetical protein
MAHPVTWPKKTLFYPIGNTSAVNLAKDLTPEEPANLLLLGWGDPRNMLYTIYSRSAVCTYSTLAAVLYTHTVIIVPRRYDFTCCDIEPTMLGTR